MLNVLPTETVAWDNVVLLAPRKESQIRELLQDEIIFLIVDEA